MLPFSVVCKIKITINLTSEIQFYTKKVKIKMKCFEIVQGTIQLNYSEFLFRLLDN